jgi:hypothetical protein
MYNLYYHIWDYISFSFHVEKADVKILIKRRLIYTLGSELSL